MVTFPKGLKYVWQINKAVKKHYKLVVGKLVLPAHFLSSQANRCKWSHDKIASPRCIINRPVIPVVPIRIVPVLLPFSIKGKAIDITRPLNRYIFFMGWITMALERVVDLKENCSRNQWRIEPGYYKRRSFDKLHDE